MKTIPVSLLLYVVASACSWLHADPAAPALPRLVDLGATKCVPCKLMKPILDKLTVDYAGRLEVVFIDVWEDREAGKRHGVRMIPTQIFYDATGKELARHEGFMSEKDILAKWKELGFELNTPAPASSAAPRAPKS